MKTQFYTFDQNNPGGTNLINEEFGIRHFVIFEAKNIEDAFNLFKNLEQRYEASGKCFNDYCGCGLCSGMRWDTYGMDEEYDSFDEPTILNKKAEEYKPPYWNQICYIHYKNGEIIRLELKTK